MSNSVFNHILTEEFWRTSWETDFLHLQDVPGNDLPSKFTIDEFVATLCRTPANNIKIFDAKLGDPFLAYLEGGSLVLNQCDRASKLLYDLCVGIRKTFCHVFSVAYLTPANTQTAPLHNDDQDVFIFQIWGEKEWRLYDSPQLLIFSDEMIGKSKPVEEKLEERAALTLKPGDVLYLPRGMPHEARATSTSSLHITVTIPTSDFTVLSMLGDYMGHLVKFGLLKDSFFCRRSILPAQGICAPRDVKALQKTQFDNLIEELKEQCTLEAIEDHFAARIQRINTQQDEIHEATQKETLPVHVRSTSKVKLKEGMICECSPGAENVTFRIGHGTLQFPIHASASHLICSLTYEEQQVSDLPCTDVFEAIALCRVLLQKECIDSS